MGKTPFVALQARALIDDVGMDNVTIHLDTYHMNIEENSMEAAVKDAEDKLGWEPAQCNGACCRRACGLCKLAHTFTCNVVRAVSVCSFAPCPRRMQSLRQHMVQIYSLIAS